MNQEKIELRSAEVQEVLEQSPAWIIRWGITVSFAIVTLFLTGSWFFKYPQILKAPVVITTENPPASIVARTNGKIAVLLVSDKQEVKAGQYLAYIENPADFNYYLRTKTFLDSLQVSFSSFDTALLDLNKRTDKVLGDLQPGYSGLIKHYQDYLDFLMLNFEKRKIKSIEQQIYKYQNYKDGLTEQSNITFNEHLINKKQYLRDSLLFSGELISETEYEKSKKTFLQSSFSVKNVDNLITSTLITIDELKQVILDLEIEFIQKRKNYESELKSQYDNLLNQFKQFEYNYVLRSPVDGKVAFTKYWSTNQNVMIGEPVFTIIPSDSRGLIGKIYLPVQRSGEVKTGLGVIIKLDNYPYKEYGAIRGTVQSISLVPSNNIYISEISLDNGLKTNYGENLNFSQEMTGTAEIITKDMRLIERLIQPVRYILKRDF